MAFLENDPRDLHGSNHLFPGNALEIPDTSQSVSQSWSAYLVSYQQMAVCQCQ